MYNEFIGYDDGVANVWDQGFGMEPWAYNGSYTGIGGNVFDIDIPDVSIDIPDINLGGGGSSGSARDKAVYIVNNYEPAFKSNIGQYKAGTISASDAARVFDQLWSQMNAQLAALGPEGERAIRERSPGGTWDWFSYYRPVEAGVPPVTAVTPPGSTVPPGTTYPYQPGIPAIPGIQQASIIPALLGAGVGFTVGGPVGAAIGAGAGLLLGGK